MTQENLIAYNVEAASKSKSWRCKIAWHSPELYWKHILIQDGDKTHTAVVTICKRCGFIKPIGIAHTRENTDATRS